MEAASQARRARLEALKKRKLGGDAAVSAAAAQDGDEDAAAQGELDPEALDTASLVRTFRNYDRTTGQAKRFRPDMAGQETVENEVKGLQEGVIAADELRRQEDLDLINIAPRKPNWDLKRDMEKRLAKLERRDKEARLILIRQRVQASAGAGAAGQLSAAEAELAASAVGAGVGGAGMLEGGAGSDDDDEADDE